MQKYVQNHAKKTKMKKNTQIVKLSKTKLRKRFAYTCVTASLAFRNSGQYIVFLNQWEWMLFQILVALLVNIFHAWRNFSFLFDITINVHNFSSWSHHGVVFSFCKIMGTTALKTCYIKNNLEKEQFPPII